MRGISFFEEPARNDYSKMIHDADAYLNEVGINSLEELPKQKPLIEERDWDIVFLFDALRWDTANIALKNYTVEPVRTLGHATPYWLKNTWTQTYPDLTYISASPMTRPHLDIEELAFIPDMTERVGDLVQLQTRHSEDLWNRKVGTFHPERVIEETMERKPPLFVHLMQPHTPFIGEVILHAKKPIEETDIHDGAGRFYPFVRDELVDVQLVRLAYFMNFIEALRAVDTFLRKNKNLDVVLTADHGEVLYQDRVSHGGENDPENQIVPWVEISI